MRTEPKDFRAQMLERYPKKKHEKSREEFIVIKFWNISRIYQA